MGIVELDMDYRPDEDEPFMNDKQKAYFKKKLEEWKAENPQGIAVYHCFLARRIRQNA